jgi:hypothetical protein
MLEMEMWKKLKKMLKGKRGNKKMKKILSCIMAVMMVMLLNPKIAKAVEPAFDIYVNSYSVEPETIYEGIGFNLTIDLGCEDAKNIKSAHLSSSSSSYYIKEYPKSDVIIKSLGSGDLIIPLRCYKTSSSFDFRIYYTTNDDNKHYTDLSVGIPIVNDDSSSGSSTTNTRKPKLLVENSKIPTVNAGDTFDLNFNVANVGTTTARDVLVEAVLDASSPFQSNEITLTRTEKEIRIKKNAEFNYEFKVDKDAKGGTYPITIKYSCKDFDGTQTIYVKVNKEKSVEESSDLTIEDIVTNPDVITAGDEFDLSFDIKRIDGFYVKDIDISLEGIDENKFTMNQDTNYRKINYLAGNADEKKVTFKLFADPDMTDGNYPLKVKMDYVNNDEDTKSVEREFFIRVKAKDDSKEKASIKIDKVIVPSDVVIPGNEFAVTFDITNTGKEDADNLAVKIDGGDDIMPVSQNIIVVNNLKVGETKQLSYKMQPSESTAAKSYLLNISVSGDAKKVDTVEQYASVKVGKLSQINIDNLVTSDSMVSPEKEFTVEFDVENKGLGTAEDLLVTVDAGEGIIPKSQSVISVSEINSNEVKHLSFVLEALKTEKSASNPITIDIKDSTGKSVVKQFTSVYVDGSGNKKTVPKVIISKFECTPKIVKAGDNFDLFLSFLNTNKIKAVSNVKIFLTVDTESSKTDTTVGTGSVFTPVDGSNTFYIDDIKPKTEQSVALKMYTIPDAQPKNYTITANIEYEDEDGNQYKSKELIGIPVTQPSQLKVGDISLESNGTVGETLPLDLQVYNIGKVTMSNFMIEIEGDFEVETQDSFAGNVQPGTVAYYYGDLKPMKAGECKGQIVFSYDEPSGEHKEVRKDISVTAEEFIMPENPMDNMDNMQPEAEPESKGGKAKIVILFGAILAGVIVLVVVLKKRKKKKGMTLDE